MLNFKTFLEDNVPFKSTYIDSEKTLEVLKNECSDSLQMIKKRSILWRGDKSMYVEQGKAIEINTSSSYRESKNTANWYTVIIDNSPLYDGFPKRSKSLICTNRFVRAAGYAYNDAQVFAVIPFNNANVACTESEDIWDVEVALSNNVYSFIEANDIFFDRLYTAGLRANWDSFKTFSARLAKDKTKKDNLIDELMILKFARKDIDDLINNFEKFIIDAYSPEQTHFTHGSVNKMKQLITSSASYEFWVQGKVILIPQKMLDELLS